MFRVKREILQMYPGKYPGRCSSRLTSEQVGALRAFWSQIDDELPNVDRVHMLDLLRELQGVFHDRSDTFRAAEYLSKLLFDDFIRTKIPLEREGGRESGKEHAVI